ALPVYAEGNHWNTSVKLVEVALVEAGEDFTPPGSPHPSAAIHRNRDLAKDDLLGQGPASIYALLSVLLNLNNCWLLTPPTRILFFFIILVALFLLLFS